MIDMETNDKKWTHPVIETRTQRIELPGDITVEATFAGHDREANRVVVSNATSRIVFSDKERVRMLAECMRGLLYFGLDQPRTDAELAAEQAKLAKAVVADQAKAAAS